MSLVGALVLIWQGVPMNFHPYTVVTSVEGGQQIIAQGPVAALEFIKNLGANGGGFFGANGAHPFENPTPLTNLFEGLAIVLLPAALTNTFGRMIRQPRQGWMLYGVMVCIFVTGLIGLHLTEAERSHHLAASTSLPLSESGGNMEGKETRFGVAGSALTAAVTSNGATGSINAAVDSFTPIGGLIVVTNMLLGEVAFGGLGTGLVGLLMAVLLAVFLAGLMVGHTPQYVGKRIGPSELKLIILYALVMPLAVLPLGAIALTTSGGLAGLVTNHGPHGLTTILVTYASSFANNGLSFGGLAANSPFYNVTTAMAMMAGRFGLVVPALALTGRFARQGVWPVTRGTLRTDSLTFGVLLIVSLVILAALSFAPALVLGPILEHLAFFRA